MLWKLNYCCNKFSGPFSPALVMEFSPYGDLKTFLTVSYVLMATHMLNDSDKTGRKAASWVLDRLHDWCGNGDALPW